MDVFKILTRSSRLGRPSGESGKRAQIPSQGPTENPRLFGFDEPPKKRQKKAPKDSELPAELNFFGEKRNTAAAEEIEIDPEDESEDEEGQELNEDECRAVHKQHKLKITVLDSDRRNAQIFPRPLLSFGQLKGEFQVSKRLVRNISLQGYSMPTEVQIGSLPLLLLPDLEQLKIHSDLLVVAPTGSGKTLAFLIPLFNNIMAQKLDEKSKNKPPASIRSIILAPTKELVGQIVNEGRKLSMGTGIKTTRMTKNMRFCGHLPAATHSGSESEEETMQTVTKTDLLVATPLAFLNVVKRCKDCNVLASVRSLIFDEADVLLDKLFRDQTLSIWEKCTDPALRVSLWSATMGSSIESLAQSTIEERHYRLGIPGDPKILRLVVGIKDSALPNVMHKLIYAATEQGKLLGLRELLHPASTKDSTMPVLHPPFLVFTQTISRAIALHSELLYDIPIEAGGSARVAVLHADLSDRARETIMDRFRAGEIWILITTDLLSRGVDFRGINAVVNYDIPTSAAAYIHRAGRTGRAGRSGGVSVTLYTKEDIAYVKSVANVIAASEKLSASTHGATGPGLEKWLLDSLPTPSKKAKKKLKFHGAESRQDHGTKGPDKALSKEQRRARISTKSGYQRRLEHKIRDQKAGQHTQSLQDSGSEWGGISD